MSWQSQPLNKRIVAFDKELIHAGNKGLAIDHEEVAVEVDALMATMTLSQKINQLHGLQPASIDGFYYAGGDEELGLAPYKMVDGPRGARAGMATAFPVAIGRAATFDVELERRVGLAMGLEVAAKGGNVILAPTINLLRHPGWGRAQETYSEDPWHMGAMAVAFISGAQNHVLTSPKHFALNNLEITRFDLSANIDVRSLHEVYLPHFKRSIQEAAAASVMSAYNKMNDVYCGEHPILLTDILRDDWGFTGFVESDWFLGTRSTAAAIDAGMDIEMPSTHWYSEENINEALASGELNEEAIHRNARRVVYQNVAWQIADMEVPDERVVECEEHIALAREVAEKSFVLLKNDKILPLEDTPGLKVALVGDLADTVNLGDRGSSFVTSSEVSTPLSGLQAFIKHASLHYFRSDDDLTRLGEFDICIVVAGLTYVEEGEFIPTQQQEVEEGELARGGDRETFALPDHQRFLIDTVAGVAKKTIVLLEGGSAIQVTDWLDKVDALLMLWYPGREGGHAIANVLFGNCSPSGKLPVSFPRSMDQLMPWDVNSLSVDHSLLHGYRLLDHQDQEPAFPFGFGMSYTTFDLDGLQIERTADHFNVTVSVTNTGTVSGVEIVQLYVSCTDSTVFRVPKELKGFGRAELEAGETADLEMNLGDEDLRYYDPEQNGWVLESCSYDLQLGVSSRDLPLSSGWLFDGVEWQPV
ncbi:MAG: glycosyl hydrolase [Gammaproteobacteria bacterium]|jgi:beta-glucosidase|nr:glycosyl hydrolase [Gammaproteobacteria bacterium]|tara:strand:- start:204 stop:2306 length:2103 start_codon:yes stop_codon:yes gene_type:complete